MARTKDCVSQTNVRQRRVALIHKSDCVLVVDVSGANVTDVHARGPGHGEGYPRRLFDTCLLVNYIDHVAMRL